MSYRYAYDPITLSEYHEAIVWYSERSFLAVENFISAVDEKINKICGNPTLYKSIHKKSREVSLNKFPFSIVYFINEATEMVIITSIYHHSRNPKRKYRK